MYGVGRTLPAPLDAIIAGIELGGIIIPMTEPTAMISVIFFFSTPSSSMAFDTMTPDVMTLARGKPEREEGKAMKNRVRKALSTLLLILLIQL